MNRQKIIVIIVTIIFCFFNFNSDVQSGFFDDLKKGIEDVGKAINDSTSDTQEEHSDAVVKNISTFSFIKINWSDNFNSVYNKLKKSGMFDELNKRKDSIGYVNSVATYFGDKVMQRYMIKFSECEPYLGERKFDQIITSGSNLADSPISSGTFTFSNKTEKLLNYNIWIKESSKKDVYSNLIEKYGKPERVLDNIKDYERYGTWVKWINIKKDQTLYFSFLRIDEGGYAFFVNHANIEEVITLCSKIKDQKMNKSKKKVKTLF